MGFSLCGMTLIFQSHSRIGMSAGYVPSPFLVNLQSLQNFNSNITGLDALTLLQNSVANIQEMVNYDEKRIFINTISKFNQIPIQVTDPINLSNVNLFQNGDLFTGSGASIGASGGVSLSSGGTAIFLTSTTNVSSIAIGLQVGGKTVFSFDGRGRALYTDPSGNISTGANRFWISSATLVADKVQFLGNAQSGQVLTAIDVSGTGIWKYVSSLKEGTTSVNLSSSGVFFRTNGTDAGRIDSRRNWYFGSNALVGNNDLVTSNDVSVFGGAIRYQGGGQPAVGAYLMVADSLGTLKVSTMSVGPSSFIIGDQIQSGSMSVRADGSNNFVAITSGSFEIARFNSNAVDVAKDLIVRGNLYLSTANAVKDYVFTSQGSNGETAFKPPYRLFTQSSLQEFKIDTNTASFRTTFTGTEAIRFSTGGTLYGVSGDYDTDVTGFSAAEKFSSRGGPLRFFINKTTEVLRVGTNGYIGIGTTTPAVALQVVGAIQASGSLQIGGNTTIGGSATIVGAVTGLSFAGDGSALTNIQTINVGFGSNRLDNFQNTTRTTLGDLQIAVSSLNSNLISSVTSLGNSIGTGFGKGDVTSTNLISTVAGLGTIGYLSTIPSFFVSTASLLSTLDGLGTFGYLSSGGGQPALTSSLKGLGTMSYISSAQFVSSFEGIRKNGFVFSPTATLRFPSSVGAIAIGYKQTGDLSGAIDVNGLIYSQGLRGIKAPFGLGVGQSTTATLFGYGITGGEGWKFGIQGDVDISGNLYKNGVLYSLNGMPDNYWKRTAGTSNIFFADGVVGIGVPSPTYPLDVAGKIRCFGVDIIQGPGGSGSFSTSQGSYASPWQYQGSNIYFNGGSVGIGTGISSISTTIAFDISGSTRFYNGSVYMQKGSKTLGVGKHFGSDISGTLDVSGVIHADYLEIENTGIFKGRVTAQDFLSLSDRRYKDEIERLGSPWTLLQGIRGHRYKWKSSGLRDIGLIAQDVLETLPEAVGGTMEDGLSVSYDKLIPVLIECIHDLRKEVADLKLALKK
jgi:hypothetical protein